MATTMSSMVYVFRRIPQDVLLTHLQVTTCRAHYQTRHPHTEEGNLSGPICTSHNSHTYTDNTRQPEPQLKSSSCSSVIPSHNSRDVIPSHNSRNVTCLTPITSHNLSKIAWRCSRVARRNTLPDHLEGDMCRQAPSASDAIAYKCRLLERPSPPGATRSSSHFVCSFLLAVQTHGQMLHQYNEPTGCFLDQCHFLIHTIIISYLSLQNEFLNLIYIF
ncbi:hypothetical protein DEO72_LG3g1880 [Vigna unguiculata]|uniref:Uncharacterized protein n=1 Tax=Vigna unguiculata TaxID=3917 RepID=A0A4D6LG15_VIGUN|nr:hypothetical protein DEO72_LG3g1880 [Vigna unguiculata]